MRGAQPPLLVSHLLSRHFILARRKLHLRRVPPYEALALHQGVLSPSRFFVGSWARRCAWRPLHVLMKAGHGQLSAGTPEVLPEASLAQLQFAQALLRGDNCVISAGAGCGKTSAIIQLDRMTEQKVRETRRDRRSSLAVVVPRPLLLSTGIALAPTVPLADLFPRL